MLKYKVLGQCFNQVNECNACSWDYYNTNYPQKTTNIVKSDCVKKLETVKNTRILRSILIYNKILNVNFNTSQFNATYNDFGYALLKETEILSKYYYSDLIIYFINGNHFFFTDSLKFQDNFSIFFNRVYVNITFTPIFCNFYNNIDYCVKENENIIIYLKNFKFSFFISLELNIFNIIFDGSDLNLNEIPITENNKNILNDCVNKEKLCCKKDNFNVTFISDSNNLNNLCGLLNRKIQNFNFYSFFEIQTIYDNNEIKIPQIKFVNLIFKNIISFDNLRQFINFREIGGVLLMKNIIFEDFFFFKGIIFYNIKENYLNYYENNINSNLLVEINKLSIILLENLTLIDYGNYIFELNFEEINIFYFNDWKTVITINSITFNTIKSECYITNVFKLESSKLLYIFNVSSIFFNNINAKNIFFLSDCSFFLKNITLDKNSNNKELKILNIYNSTIDISDMIISNLIISDFLFIIKNTIILFVNFSILNCQNIQFKFLKVNSTFNELRIKDSSFEGNGILFENSLVIFKNIEYLNITSLSQIFYFSNCLSILLDQLFLKFNKINSFIQGVELKSINLTNCLFRNNTINFLFAAFSIIYNINIKNSILKDLYIEAFIKGIPNTINLYLYKIWYYNIISINSSYFFQVFSGKFKMIENIFENLIFSQNPQAKGIFDIEISESLLSKCRFLNLEYNLNITQLIVLFWHNLLTTIIENIFYSDYLGVNLGFIYTEDPSDKHFIINNTFIVREKINGYYANGIILIGVPELILKNNYFLNIYCAKFNSQVQYNFGSVAIHGVSQILKVKNKFKVYILENYFSNCSCLNGGGLGILNYFQAFLINNTMENMNSGNKGGSIYAQNCEYLRIEHISIVNSSSSFGSSFFFEDNYFIFLKTALFKFSFGSKSGVIESQNVLKFFIEEVKTFFSLAKFGGILNILGGETNINNSFFNFIESFYGGGLFYLTSNASLIINKISSENSKSYDYSGFLHCENCFYIELIDLNIFNSKTIRIGAVLLVKSIVKLNIKNVKLINCSSDSNAILSFLSDQNNTIYNLSSILCFNNKAIKGSCIFYDSNSILNIYNINIIKNDGVSIFLNYIYLVKVFIFQGNFIDSYETKNFLESYNINLVVIDILFKNNVMINSLYYIENCNLILKKNYFENSIINEDFNNELIYSLYSSLNIENSVFKNNILENSKYLILNLKFSELSMNENLIKNHHHNSDCLIYIEISNVKFFRDIFINNTVLILKSIDSNCELNSIYMNNYGKEKESITEFYFTTSFSQIYSSFHILNSYLIINKGQLAYLVNLDIIKIENSILTNEFKIKNEIKMGFSLINIDLIYINKLYSFCLRSVYGSSLEVKNEESKQDTFIFNNSFAYNNIALIGGAFFLQGEFIINFSNCKFLNNKAERIDEYTGIGGVLFFINSFNSLISKFYLIHCQFENNLAEFIAPTFYSDIQIINQNNTFVNNVDNFNFTTHISCSPFFIIIEELVSSLDRTKINNLTIISGEPIELNFRIVDSYNQTLSFINKSNSMIKPAFLSEKTINSIENYFSSINLGYFKFDNLIIKGKPNFSFTIEIETYYNFLKFSRRITKDLLLSSRTCSIGEIYTLDFTCKKCGLNSYSYEDPSYYVLNNKFQSCFHCPSNAFCPGGKIVIPVYGYWKSSPYTLTIVACLTQEYCLDLPNDITIEDILKKNDLFQEKTYLFTGTCAFGHERNLCQECILDYGKYTNNSLCESCKSFGGIAIFRLIVIILIILFYLFLSSQSMFKESESSVFDTCMKILINHLQKISLITIVEINNLMNELKKFMNFLDSLSFLTEDIFSNDCFIQPFISNEHRDLFYIYKVFVTLLLPIFISFLSLIILICVGLFYYLKFKTKPTKILKKLFLLFLISLFLFYPMITKSSISLMYCIKLDDSDDTYMYNSPNLKCWQNTHYTFFFIFGIIGIILFGIGFPLILCVLIGRYKKSLIRKNKGKDSSVIIFKNNTVKSELLKKEFKEHEIRNEKFFSIEEFKKNMETDNTIEKKESFKTKNTEKKLLKTYNAGLLFNFFYKDYQNKFYYWESVIFLQKFLMTLNTNLSGLLNEEYRDFLFFIILFTYTYYLILLFPFKDRVMNFLEINSLVTSIITRLTIIISKSKIISSDLSVFLFIVQVFMNSQFFLSILYVFIKYSDWKKIRFRMKQTYFSILNKLSFDNRKVNSNLRIKKIKMKR